MLKLITTKQAAAMLGRNPGTLRHWRMAKKHLSYVIINGAIRYKLEDVEGLIEAGTINISTDSEDLKGAA